MNLKEGLKSNKIVHTTSLSNQLSSYPTNGNSLNGSAIGGQDNMLLLKNLIKTNQIINFTKKYENTSMF